VNPAPYHRSPDETLPFTPDSVFWFNFFPAQPALFEKTFAVWGAGQMQPALRLGGHVARRGGGVDPFVQVNNLNRFSSLPGYFKTAHEAGRHTFTLDSDYLWYGMLLRKLP
jgi:hypothetical protein